MSSHELSMTATITVPDGAEPVLAYDGRVVGFTVGGKTYRPQMVWERHDPEDESYTDLTYEQETEAGFDRDLGFVVYIIPLEGES